MRSISPVGPICAGLLVLLANQPTRRPSAPHTAIQPAAPPATTAAQLEVGAPAPPFRAAEWLNGGEVNVAQPGEPKVIVLTFWATWSEPSRAALERLQALHERYRRAGVAVVAFTDEPVLDVREFLGGLRPQVTFRIAIDSESPAPARYCDAAGLRFLPCVFVIGPDRTIAWFGHPQQAELETVVQDLLAGRYDVAQVRERVRRAAQTAQLEAAFRDAYARRAWSEALIALDALLNVGSPKERLLRYKLAIVLGELDEPERPRRFVEEILREHAGDARLLNSLAWDVASEPRLFMRDPDLALRLARAAYVADGGNSADVLDTYARALYGIGRIELAIEVQERAVSRADTDKRPQLEGTLAFYRRCLKLQPEASATPN